jgi:hypothetical protein
MSRVIAREQTGTFYFFKLGLVYRSVREGRRRKEQTRHAPRHGSGHILFLLANYAGNIMLARASVDHSFGWA